MVYGDLKFKTYEEYLAEYRCYHMHECSVCGAHREQSEGYINVFVEDKHLEFQEILVLQCLNCGKWVLPMHSKEMIDGAYKNSVKENRSHGLFYPRGYKKVFDYCTDVGLNYDHRDYYNIPGLSYDEEHSLEGFLTPVYFTKKGLYHFLYDPEYKLHLFSETYGRLRYKDEWDIPFGINRLGKLVFWLGDLSYMDDLSLQILKPHNTDSDHQLIESEFYAAQMCCIWSEPNREMKICFQRKELYDQIMSKTELKLFHLEDEINEQMDSFQKPLIITEATLEPSINLLHKVLIEGVNIPELKKLYFQFTGETPGKEWKSIKLFQGILGKSITDPGELRQLMSPMYLLNDLRQYYDHLLPNEKKEKIRDNIIESLQIESFDQIEEIYSLMLKRLGILYEYLEIAIEK